MKREVLRKAVQLNIERRRRKGWHRVVSVLAGIVVFVTTYALILPAITMEHETVCGLDEHTHSQACWYAPVLNTGRTQLCAPETHVHGADCYDSDGTEICGYADFLVHIHDACCYDAEGELVCSLPERYEHTHTDGCYQETVTYACGQSEGEGRHVHDETCYAPVKPVCGTEEAPEHTHGEDCYGRGPLMCGAEESEEHTHSESCYDAPELICQLEESVGHTHGEQCFPEKQLLCMREEQPGHVHDETCGREVVRELVCDEDEVILHTHTAECFDEAGTVVCGMRQILQHQHDDECFAEHSHAQECYAEDGNVLVCGYHVHESECFDEQGYLRCGQPILICGMEEHIHEESCYPPKDDGMADVTFAVEDPYLAHIRSEAIFPLTVTLPEGASLLESGVTPSLTVVNPDGDTPVWLEEYHWVTLGGIPVDETVPVAEDVTLWLKLYPAEQPKAAQLVTATFVCDGETLLTRKVNYGSAVFELPDPETLRKTENLESDWRSFVGWSYFDEDLEETLLADNETVITRDTVYYAAFQEYVPVTVHDIAPDGSEYSDSPLMFWLPVGETLSEQWDAVLGDETPIPACEWYEEDGTAFDAESDITQPLELYTYSYVLRLEMKPKEPPEDSAEAVEQLEETGEQTSGVLSALLMALSLSGETFDTYEVQESLPLEEEPPEDESESVSIVKRSGDALTATDFVMDGINYSNYQWLDESGNDVDTNDLIGTTLTSNYALVLAASTDYTINYNINVNASGVFGTVPTVGGGRTLSDSFNSDEGTYTLRVPTPANYMTTSGNKRTLYRFTGWKVSRTGKIVAAGETVNAAWVSSSVNRRTTTVTLTAQWSSVVVTETVHFFVNLNCQVADVEGNTEIPQAGDFTPSVFSTTMSVTGASMKNYWRGAVVGGSQYVLFRADNATDTEAIDAEIRRLIGGHDSTYDTYNGVSVWKSGYTGTKVFQVEDFPSDERVLSVVRDMVRNGTQIRMNGVLLTADELTADNFTVRWNVCKYDTGDGWHIDGILVGKQAYLTVKKTFLGDDEAVRAVKDGGFTITVDNTSNSAAADITLTLNAAVAESRAGMVGYTRYDASEDTYTWILPLEQSNRYSIIENNYISADAAVQTSVSYTIRNSPDAFVGWAAYPDEGITGITAVAYANDVAQAGYQTVALRNAYVKADTLTINKIDMATGNGMGGVSYRLTDVDGEELILYRKPDTGYYSMNHEDQANGFVRCADSIITTGSNGAIFLKLDNGTFTLEEAFPTGYGGASTITVTVGADSDGNVTFEEVRSSDSTIEVDGVLVDAKTATLTIRNVSYPTSVTAQKIWTDASEMKAVTVALCRNGVAMGSEYQAVLNQSNNWRYTWSDLPLYADGDVADYTLREIVIGDINYDPTADTDGYSGYIVSYDEILYYRRGEQVDGPAWVDQNGVTQYADNARLVVRNEVYRGQMVFLKVDGNGAPLAGATFRLYADASQTEMLAEATSDTYGRVIFESLRPDTYYVVKEADTPDGYLGADSLYKVRLSAQGSTTVEDTSTGEMLTAIVNYADEAEVQLHKVSELGVNLSGVQFRLDKQVDGAWKTLGFYETNGSGLAALGKVAAGTYRLTEMHPPDGYMALDGAITFEILQGEVTLLNSGDWLLEKDTATKLFTVTVVNKSGYELPQTGGPTARMYTYGGLLMVLAAAALFGYQIIRRKGDDSS